LPPRQRKLVLPGTPCYDLVEPIRQAFQHSTIDRASAGKLPAELVNYPKGVLTDVLLGCRAIVDPIEIGIEVLRISQNVRLIRIFGFGFVQVFK
jgi:hypothetical protein